MLSNQGSSTQRKESGYEMVTVESDENKSKITSPLIQAAKIGDLKKLNEYLDKGGNIFEVDNSGASILHWAVDNDDFNKAIECSEEILNRIFLHSTTEDFIKFIEHQDNFKQSALIWAVGKGNDKVVRILLDRGAKPGVTHTNSTVFHILAKLENYEQALFCAEILLDAKYYKNNLENLKEYLNEEESLTNRTALHKAGIYGNHDLIQLLISNGSDPMKFDFVRRNIFHLAIGNAHEEKAFSCTKVLLQDHLTDGWSESKDKLLRSFDISGKAPIHIASRRGFDRILSLLSNYYLISEGKTGFTALHNCANLGNQTDAEKCVRELLHQVNPTLKTELLNSQDQNGCTALYLSAKEKNVEACKLLLSEGSAFDIMTKHGKTPLEKVYKNVPQAVNFLLEKSIKNSGYVAYIGGINTHVELDFGPILGYSTSKSNIYKETEELAKVCYAKFEDRKEILNHILIKVFIHKKWERVKHFFLLFRIFHILWYLYNCFFLVTTYRIECPHRGANPLAYTWLGLRPSEEVEGHNNVTKNLSECEISGSLYSGGLFNIVAVCFYTLSQFHQSKQQFHWLVRPMKSLKYETSYLKVILKTISHYIGLFFRILPCWPLLLGTGIIITTLPVIGVIPFEDPYHYIIAGLMGLLIWLAIYLELGKFPKFRVYINLLMRSTRTLLLAIAVTAPILFGFANVFVILIPGEPAFSTGPQSFVKVITFMIGELDYNGLFYGEKETVFLGIVMLALAVFIVIIVVLLVNFLIGLAAEEIRDFWERAEIWKLCTQLEQIVMLESFLDESVTVCGRRFLRKNLMLMPPDRKPGQDEKQKRRARIEISTLPKQMQKQLHDLKFRTIAEVNY